MNILFVMKHRGNAGNTHAVADYMRVARSFGHRVAIFGAPLPYLPELEFSLDVNAFDKVVYLFESELYRVNILQEVILLGNFARRDRLILDMDGMYNPLIQLDHYDRNHASQAERDTWIDFYDALADRVAKPIVRTAGKNPNVKPLAFYGYDAALEIDPTSAPEKRYDIVHIGHNWWRWKQMSEEILPAIEPIRNELGGIAFIGLWWDAPPEEGPTAGPEEAFRSDSAWLRRLRIRTEPAVMYDEVVNAMSTARINIFTQRPVLRHLKHLTLKYFEIFYADTIPLLMLDPDHAETVYGSAGRELTLTGQVGPKILDALRRPERYRELVQEVRVHLARHHSYGIRLAELVAALQS